MSLRKTEIEKAVEHRGSLREIQAGIEREKVTNDIETKNEK